MKINELEKIVNDGLVKYKAFKDADDAINQVKALVQAEADLKRVVGNLEKTREALKGEVSSLNGKIEAAQVKAADIVAKAEAQATAAIEAAQDTIATNQAKADKKLLDTNKTTSDAETRRVAAEGMAKDAEANLAELTAAVDKQKAAMKKLIGE